MIIAKLNSQILFQLDNLTSIMYICRSPSTVTVTSNNLCVNTVLCDFKNSPDPQLLKPTGKE